MDYYLTKHAKQRMVERSISSHLLDEVLQNPTEILYDKNCKELYKYVYTKGSQKRLLIVVVIPEKDKLKIITVIDTSKVRKYL